MKKKITIYDLAEATGFSVGTVSRALSGKSRIKPETKQLILATAKKLGYRVNAAAQGLRRTPIKIGAVLFCPVREYSDAIIEGMNSSAADLEKYNVTVNIKSIEYTDNAECCQKTLKQMKSFYKENYNGVILFISADTAEAREISDMIEEMAEKNIFVATVANDIVNSRRILHVGINAFMAGRMAAELLWLCCPHGKIALLTSSENSEVNNQYMQGFFDFSGENRFSDIKIYKHFDNHELVITETRRMLDENPQLDGIYMTTASSAIACRQIKKSGRSGIKIITTDLLRETPEILSEGTACAAIFQNPYQQGRDVVKLLYNYIVKQTGAGKHYITPNFVFSSNIQDYKIF